MSAAGSGSNPAAATLAGRTAAGWIPRRGIGSRRSSVAIRSRSACRTQFRIAIAFVAENVAVLAGNTAMIFQ